MTESWCANGVLRYVVWLVECHSSWCEVVTEELVHWSYCSPDSWAYYIGYTGRHLLRSHCSAMTVCCCRICKWLWTCFA